MKKKLISCIAAAVFSIQTAAYCADLSGWAESAYLNASSMGLISYNVAANKLSDNITREEFCDLTVNLYERLSGEQLREPEILPFIDSDSMAVSKAYSLGIVAGNEKGEFQPTNLITRQEMSKMLVTTLDLCGVEMSVSSSEKDKLSQYSDYESISGWATDYMSKAIKYGIMNGTSKTTLDPLGNATREQAIATASRSYDNFSKNAADTVFPTITAPENNSATVKKVTVKWKLVNDADCYYVIVKNANSVPVYQQATDDTSFILDSSVLADGDYSVIVGVSINGIEYFSMPVDFSFTKNTPTPSTAPTQAPKPTPSAAPIKAPKPVATQIPKPTSAPSDAPVVSTSSETTADSLWQYALTSVTPAPVPLAEKEAVVFPNGKRFESSEEAEAYMTEIEIPVWLIKNGEKVSSTKTLTVNSALAEDVKQIFNEIYALPIQYPIKSIGGYCWRNSSSGRLSQHSYGTCIDINPNENYYVSSSGTAYSGSYWKPGEDPYSINLGDGIIEIFAAHGWTWGGNAWSSSHDYMHFTYLGN